MGHYIYYNSKAGIILAQNDNGPLKWANGPYPIQIHANFQILMGHLKFLWALCKIWRAQESLISTLEHNWHEIWIACIWGPAKNKVHFSKTLIVFSQNGPGPILGLSLSEGKSSLIVLLIFQCTGASIELATCDPRSMTTVYFMSVFSVIR